MSITPFFISPFTDLTGAMINHQTYDSCGKFEMNMMECLEAYGADKGQIKCKVLIEDFNECYTKYKQLMRCQAMRNERIRQYWAGERTKEELFAKSPRFDAY